MLQVSRWLPLAYLGLVAVAFAALIVASMNLKQADKGSSTDSLSRSSPQPRTEFDGSARRPLPRQALSGASPGDPILKVGGIDACPERCTGTAFAIDDRGHWLTARHVAGSCTSVGLIKDSSTVIPVHEVFSHPSADVSLITTRLQAPALALHREGLVRYQEGFHYGFPGGKPGDVHARLLGRVWVRASRTTEPGIVWAETGRRVSSTGSLGGLSGGPVLTSAGTVVGVTIAASARRGRVISAAPSSLAQAVELAGLDLVSLPEKERRHASVDTTSYLRVGESLRSDFTVAKVLCVGKKSPARRRPGLM